WRLAGVGRKIGRRLALEDDGREVVALDEVFGIEIPAVLGEPRMQGDTKQSARAWLEPLEVDEQGFGVAGRPLIQTPDVAGLMLDDQERVGLAWDCAEPDWVLEP